MPTEGEPIRWIEREQAEPEEEEEAVSFPETIQPQGERAESPLYGESGEIRPERERLSRSQTPEALVDLMSFLDAVQFRELKLNEKHGEGRLGRIKKFLAGERDFALTEDGQIRKNGWRELGRKALVTVFNRRTVLAAGTLGVIGVFTGGVGLPAGMALAGTVVGRGAAEAWYSIRGEERGLREEIALKHYEQWSDLRDLASKSQDEALPQEERHQALTKLIEDFHQTSQPVREREEELKEVRQRWDKRRNTLMAIGGAVGLEAGIWMGFQGLSQMATRLDLDADGISHHVEKMNDIWHFAYNNVQEALDAHRAGATAIKQLGIHFYHVVGPDAAKIPWAITKNLLPELGQVAGVLAGLELGVLSGKRAEAGRVEEEAREEVRQERRYREGKERLMKQVPEVKPLAEEQRIQPGTGSTQPAAEPAKKETVQKTEQKVIDLDKEVEKLQSELQGETVGVEFERNEGSSGRYWAEPSSLSFGGEALSGILY